MFWDLIGSAKKTLWNATEGVIEIVDTWTWVVWDITKTAWEQVLKWSEVISKAVDIKSFDGIVDNIEGNKDKLFSWLEKQFIEKTNLWHETFQKMKTVSDKIVSNVWNNIDELQGKKGDVLSFINNEIKESNIDMLSDLDLENWEQEEIANFMLIMVWLGIIIMFPALIPEIIWAIINPIDILQIILESDDEEK